jgi:tRNA (cmo5U34)-methyltransferase
MSAEIEPRAERMETFFDERANGYDEHMRHTVTSFEAFYAAVARPIRRTNEVLRILDIGCGTGLEFEEILERAPNARITGIDLSERMLAHLQVRYAARRGQIDLIRGSYLALPVGGVGYDYVVSVMTLHHLLPARKAGLYERIRRALRVGGHYIEGDYVVGEAEAARLLATYHEVMEQPDDDGIYHVDIPLTVEVQRELLLGSGFASVEVTWREGAAAVFEAGT